MMKLLLGSLLVLAAGCLSGAASAHGGVSIEDDHCILSIAAMRAHFTGYQPELRATQEFCEDIPELGRAIIVIDYISQELRQQKVEFRVLKDEKNLKSAGRYETLGTPEEIDAATIARMPAAILPRGTLTFEHRFEAQGWYIGLLTATDEATGKVEHSVFPFRVGVRHYGKYFISVLFAVGLAVLAYYLTRRKPFKAAAVIS